jgi:hypothetical protein
MVRGALQTIEVAFWRPTDHSINYFAKVQLAYLLRTIQNLDPCFDCDRSQKTVRGIG